MSTDVPNQEQGQAVGGSALTRTLMLAAIFLCLLVITCAQLLKDPIIGSRIGPMFGSSQARTKTLPDLNEVERMDPALGTELPRTAAGNAIRASVPASRRGYFIAELGTCTECTKFSFSDWAKECEPLHVSVIGLSNGDQSAIDTYLRNSHVKSPIIRDRQGETGRLLNAYWGGRVYYFDSHWKLRWIMHGMGSPTTPKQIPGLEEFLHAS